MYVVFQKHDIRAEKLWSGASWTTKTLHDHKQSVSFRFEAIAAQRCGKQKRTSGKQVDKFLSLSETYTKFRGSKNNFTRLKVQSYRINEIWSGDLADVHQLAKDNDGQKILLVFVDCLSRFSRVEPIDSKSAQETRAALEKRRENKNPKKFWVDKGKEFKEKFAKFCLEKNIKVYSTHSEQKSCFAERYIRTLKSILFKYLHENNTSKYIDQIQNFVSLINSRPTEQPKLLPKNLPDTMYLT